MAEPHAHPPRGLAFSPLAHALGARVEGIALDHPLADSDFRALLRAGRVEDVGQRDRTAWLDAAAIGAPEGAAVARLLEAYAHVRLAYITSGPDTAAERTLLARTAALQSETWQAVTPLVRRAPNTVTTTLMHALTATFENALAERLAFSTRVPHAIQRALIVGSVLSIGTLGFQIGAAGRRQLVLTTLLALMWTGGHSADDRSRRAAYRRDRSEPRAPRLDHPGFLPPPPPAR